MKDDHFAPPYNDLMGDILKKHTAEGGMDNLKGQGKPLPQEYFSGDTFQHFQRIAKDAGYKPQWLRLQHDIRDEVMAIAEGYVANPVADWDNRIDELNSKIFAYNQSCPPPLQKGSVSLTTIQSAIERWK
ncbi:DnaJ family domain-containing protein [Sporosarcina beigongshangi]|uniref:DnaJ family domain-containing protein n=1 Tax=Sporosarcina beigongshangi TaxID=2782538 RepID=UPI0019397172|nr:DnaJ family domain-containing protein [Sporosarcina beigongshangi]